MKKRPAPVAPELLAARFWAKVDRRRKNDCWPWTGARNSCGYGVLRNGSTLVLAHRVSLALAGRDPGALHALHSCDNPCCVNPAHLGVGTQAENLAQMVERGRSNIGERNGAAKLTAADVATIRARLAAGERQTALAAEYRVSIGTMSPLARGATWKHVQAA